MTPAATESALVRLIRAGLPLATEPEPPATIDLPDWPEIANLACQEGIAPLLFVALRACGRLRDVPPAAARDLRAAYLRSYCADWQAREQMGGVLDLFAREGIPVVLLKGAALSSTLYGRVGLRTMGDIDLLVPGSSARQVLACLTAGGYRTPEELATGFQSEFASEQLFVRDGETPERLEVHWHLFDLPYYRARIPIGWFWERTEGIPLAGREARVFLPEAQILHLAGHFVLHHGGEGLRWSYDIALLLLRHGAAMRWGDVVEAARAFGLARALQEALARVRDTWGVTAPAEASARLDGLRSSFAERLSLAAATARGTDAHTVWDGLSLPGTRAKLIFFLHKIFPSVAYMRQRYRIRGTGWLPAYYVWRIGKGFFWVPISLVLIGRNAVRLLDRDAEPATEGWSRDRG